MLENAIIYLVGPPGVGKLTVGQALAQATGCKVIHNHYWLNPIFGLIHQDGVTPLPKGIWPLVEQVRGAVLETIVSYSPPDWSFVFTHSAVANPEYHEADMVISRDIASVAAQRNARMIAVRLSCSAEQLARRVAAPERRQLMKEANVEAARSNAAWGPFDPGWSRTMAIDTSDLSAQQTAERIIEHLKTGG
jgi:shikimate kinase